MIPWKQQLLPIIELIIWLVLESSKQFASISPNFDTKKNYSSGYEISKRLVNSHCLIKTEAIQIN